MAPVTTTTIAAASAAATSQHSLRQLVRDQITEYSRLTQSLFASLDVLVEGKVTPTPPNDIMKQIVQLDATLMGAVEKIELHQQQQQRIRQVRVEIEEQNKAIMNVIQNLRDAKQVLETSLEDQDQKQAISADARSAEVSVTEIVAYANRLSNYTSAPPNFNPQDPNQPFEPPYPREVNMRAGILNQQHIPAAALVSLDGGVMPGTAGQPVPPTSQQLQQQQQGQQAQQPASLGVGGPGAPSSAAATGALGGVANHANNTAAVGSNVHGVANGSHLLPHEMMMLDDDDEDSDSSSEDEGFSLYERVSKDDDEQQGGGEQQHGNADEADIFDLDLN
ncbi:vitamin-D-receptor interacting mediator subunit 4-domain-containing protein [Dissophora ornata]|nr:vitamin-D-receptor interacting mediator subunit 4-domain-containing protein [Dissophora ornata]